MTSPFQTADEALDFLTAAGQGSDESIDIVECALAYSLADAADKKIDSYRDYLRQMQSDLRGYFEKLSAQKNNDDVSVQVEVLRHVFATDQGYTGASVNYDDLGNINLFSVIDRRTGMPISLCILAIGLCRAMGWMADGVNFPGHFLMRLEKEGERILINPFDGCKIMEAKDLRLLLKCVVGEQAELSADYYEACNNREILLRYRNNVKYRLIDQENYEGALEVVRGMTLISPNDYRLSLDKAVLYARLDQTQAAITELKRYLELVQNPYDKAEAEAFLHELKKQLN